MTHHLPALYLLLATHVLSIPITNVSLLEVLASRPCQEWVLNKKRAAGARFLQSDWRRAGDSGLSRCERPIRYGPYGPCALRWQSAFALFAAPRSLGFESTRGQQKSEPQGLASCNQTGGELGIRTPDSLWGEYSLSRRAPSASRSALRNSQMMIAHFRQTAQASEKLSANSDTQCSKPAGSAYRPLEAAPNRPPLHITRLLMRKKRRFARVQPRYAKMIGPCNPIRRKTPRPPRCCRDAPE